MTYKPWNCALSQEGKVRPQKRTKRKPKKKKKLKKKKKKTKKKFKKNPKVIPVPDNCMEELRSTVVKIQAAWRGHASRAIGEAEQSSEGRLHEAKLRENLWGQASIESIMPSDTDEDPPVCPDFVFNEEDGKIGLRRSGLHCCALLVDLDEELPEELPCLNDEALSVCSEDGEALPELEPPSGPAKGEYPVTSKFILLGVGLLTGGLAAFYLTRPSPRPATPKRKCVRASSKGITDTASTVVSLVTGSTTALTVLGRTVFHWTRKN